MQNKPKHVLTDRFKRYKAEIKKSAADYLNDKSAGFSAKQNKIFLAAFFLLFSSVFTYLILKAII